MFQSSPTLYWSFLIVLIIIINASFSDPLKTNSKNFGNPADSADANFTAEINDGALPSSKLFQETKIHLPVNNNWLGIFSTAAERRYAPLPTAWQFPIKTSATAQTDTTNIKL